jgi:plasmid stabilization system protein ParE
MSRKFEIRARALRDLRAIALFIATQTGESLTAQRFAQRLLDQCARLADIPGMGTPYAPRSGIRKLNVGAHKIFYQVTSTKVIVLRIWDGRRGHDPFL